MFFPIVSLLGIMKPTTSFLLPQLYFRQNLTEVGPVALEIQTFESMDAWTHGRTDGRRIDYFTISSPCEPSAQAS